MNVTNDLLDDVASEVSEYLTHYIDGATTVTITPSMVEQVLDNDDPALLRADFGSSTSWVVSLIREVASRAADPITEAVDVLFRNRHHLAPDALRSLQSIYLCASAARYGEPHEAGWLEDAEFYAAHDVAGCEEDDQPGQLDDDSPLAPIADPPGDTPWPEARRILAERIKQQS